MTKLEHKHISGIVSFVHHMNECDKKTHFQQVVYSVHKAVFTAVCFNCMTVTTTAVLDSLPNITDSDSFGGN